MGRRSRKGEKGVMGVFQGRAGDWVVSKGLSS